jgi:hypothetical protein
MCQLNQVSRHGVSRLLVAARLLNTQGQAEVVLSSFAK